MVSVIVPAYNMEKYITRCLCSLATQTYRDLQVIVVDDGSTDRTLEIANGIATKDHRITVFHKKNGGVSSARNYGIEKASGEYTFFFDPDDVLEEEAIEVLVKAMNDGSYDMVACQYSRWDDADKRLDDYDFIIGERYFPSDNDRLAFFVNELLDYHVGYEVWNKLFKTSIIMDKKVRFSEKCKIGEDLAFNIKYMMHVLRINNISDRCVRYTIRTDSAMGTAKELSDRISEDMLLTNDIWEYIIASDNNVFFDKFPILFVKMIEHSYVGHTPTEIVNAIKNIPDIVFMKDRYQEIDSKKDEIIAIYPTEIAKLKYRYHQCVRLYAFGEDDLHKKLPYLLCNVYRKLRGRETLETWKMPY